MKKKFGLLSVLTTFLVIGVVLISKTGLLTQSRVYIEGSGEERVEKVIDAFHDGNRLVILDRNDRADMNHLIDRVYDNPNLFWIDMKYNAMSIGDMSFLAVHEKYDDIEKKRQEIEIEAQRILNDIITTEMSEYDKTLAIYDWICENVKYEEDEKKNSDQDIYGALILRKARCAGYAKAFSYLLEKVGIRSEVISGESIDINANSVMHAWNVAWIDETPYYFDVTWDDHENQQNSYEWFGITASEFKKSHFPSNGYEWEEDAIKTDANYYIKNEMYIEYYSPSAIAKQIKKQGTMLTIKCKDFITMKKTIAALSDEEEIMKIMRESGLTRIGQIKYTENKSTNCIRLKFL